MGQTSTSVDKFPRFVNRATPNSLQHLADALCTIGQPHTGHRKNYGNRLLCPG